MCFIYTCRLKFEVSSSDSASEIKEDSDSEMENDWAEEQHSFYNSDLELPVGLCQNPDRTGWWTGPNRTGPDQTKYTGKHKLLSAREVTIVTCVQAIQIQQAATVTSMEQAVEIQQSTTVTSMEQVIEIVSDDGDFWEQH